MFVSGSQSSKVWHYPASYMSLVCLHCTAADCMLAVTDKCDLNCSAFISINSEMLVLCNTDIMKEGYKTPDT